MLFRTSLIAALCAVMHTASSATFVFNYLDSAGVGFNDAVFGADRRETLQSVGDRMAAMLGGYDVTVRIDVNPSQFDGTGALAQSGIRYPGAMSFPTGIWGGRLHQAVTTSVDGNGPASAEAIMIWDLGRDWYLGEDPAGIGSNAFDFRSVALHELTHAMGLASAITPDGSGFRGNAPGSPDVFSIYDSFLQTSLGVPLIDGAAFNLDVVASLTANDIFFAGANAVAANGGLPVPIYAPSVWNDGSSISHLAAPDDLMYYGFVRGQVNRDWSEIDVAILRDLGYEIVPEPGVAGLLVAALSIVVLRRANGMLRVRRGRAS